MILFLLSTFIYLSHGGANWGCRAYRYLDHYRVFDVCFSEKASNVVESNMYSCKSDGSGVDITTWNNVDCSGTPTLTETETFNAGMFDCNATHTNCEYVKYRIYDATANGNECTKGNDYVDELYAVENCFSSKIWMCTENNVTFDQYYWNIIDTANSDYECERDVDKTNGVVDAGCDSTNTKFIEIMDCSPLTESDTTTTAASSTDNPTSGSSKYNYTLNTVVILILSSIVVIYKL
eukprot:400005_1